MERARGEQDASCAIASPPSPYLGWLTINMCICNGQQSSEIFCGKYIIHTGDWPIPRLVPTRRTCGGGGGREMRTEIQ
jgi:hypothetical protein